MDIQISFHYRRTDKRFKVVRTSLKRFALNIKTSSRIYVALVSDKTIQKLNAEFLKKDKPTNVMSFEMNQREPESGLIVTGEIIISVDTARKEALNAGIPLEQRLIELFVHGYVHLLGLDHTKGRAEALKMKKKERYFLQMFD